MFKRSTLSILALAAVIATQVDAQDHDHNPDVSEVRVLIESIANYMQDGDLAPLDDIFAPGRGVHIIEGAGVNHGWAEYRDHHLAPELKHFENFMYRFHSIEPVVRGELAFAAFRYDMSAETARGEIEMEGRGTAVLERMDGAWRVIHYHTSGRPRREG